MSIIKKKLDLVVVGGGLSALNFIDTYLDNHKQVNVISPKNPAEQGSKYWQPTTTESVDAMGYLPSANKTQK